MKLDQQADKIMEAVAAGKSQRQIAKEFKVARSTLQDWLRQPRRESVKDVDIMEAEVKDLRRQLTAERTIDVQAERVMRTIEDAVQAAPAKYEPLRFVHDRARPHTQALLLSDTHAGEVVVKEAVNGLNEYSWKIMEDRMKSIQSSLLSFQAARPYPIQELQVWALGDMLSGSNHQELAETNEFPIAEQAFRFGMLLGQWVEELVPNYGHIQLHGISGNHPRVNIKPASKQVFNNFDWVAYMIAQAYLREYIAEGSVTVQFPRSTFHVVEIAGQKVCLMHGDGIRSTMPGVPWGGVMRRWNEIRKQFSQSGVHLDAVALGHFHQAACVPGIFMNGSVKGVDEYSLKQFGGGEKPTQLLLTYDEHKERLTDVSYITP